jgi:hypothetical protein
MKGSRIIIALACFTLCSCAMALERVGRLGVGFHNQFKTDIPAVSFKLQKSSSSAFSGSFGIDTDSNTGGYGAGLKYFRNLFDEPQANFYVAALGAMISQKQNGGEDQSGFQFDLSLGSEFSFAGLSSLGFSFEFGVSLNKLKDFVIQTTGQNFVVGSVHFYL